MLQDKKGKVLTLIYQNHQGRLVVDQQTLRHISSFKGQYSFLSICGEYRSGKSFLLNSLFFDYEGFQTSGTTEACTKGIKIWSQPVKHNENLIWLLDTQGFGSIDKDSNYDGKILLTTLLISNILLYNSFGAIDQNTIAKLALVCQQSKFLQKNTEVSLFWVLRDFSLEMIDKEGRQLTEDQYLQECLKQGNIKGQKQLIKKVFPQRHCVTLIRPVIDEAKLNNLHGVDKIYLRQEFKHQVQNLRKRMQRSLKGKKIEGVTICNKNIKVVMTQFVQLMNKSQLQWDLNCSYQRVKKFQMDLLKQKMVEMIHNKIQNIKKLLPVKQEHIQYAEKQISELLTQQLSELKEYANESSNELFELQMKQIVREQLEKLQKTNINSISQQIKDYLYRRIIEMYPQIIVLNHSQLENKLQESLIQLKETYTQKYTVYFKNQRDLEYFYTAFIEKQIRKLFYQLTKRWKNQQKQLQNKLQQLKKYKKNSEQELKRNKEEKEKSIKSLEMYRREQGRSLSKLKQQIQSAFKQEMTVLVKDYQQKLKTADETIQKLQKQTKSQLEMSLQEKTALVTNWQYQKQGLLQKIELQKQRCQMTNIKYEQLKNTFDFELQQFKNSYENKLKIMEMKFNETSNTLSTQRRKFQMLSEQRRVEENQLLMQIQEQNDQINDLTNEIKELQVKYKNQLEKILSQQKQILVKTITNKIQEYQYKCKVYEGKLQEATLSLKDLQFYSQKNDELQIQVRELKSKLQDQSDKASSLQNKICKMELQLTQQQEYIEHLKAEFQKQISLANQNLYNNKKFIKEAEQRHKQQVDYYKKKIQSQLTQQSANFASAHEENIRQNKAILQQKFEKERTQLKDIIRNNYEEIQTLKVEKSFLVSQLEKIYSILNEIKKSHQNATKQSKMASLYQHQESQSSFQLANISESPEEYSRQMNGSDKKQKIQKMHFMAEQIYQINESLQQQIKIFGIQRQALKKQLELYAQKADSYETHFNKASSQNKQFKAEIQQLRKKSIAYQNLKKTSQLVQQKYQSAQKQLTLLKNEIQVKNTLNQQKQQSIKQNFVLYKETIAQLTQENRIITEKFRTVIEKNNVLQSELQRFNLWAQEVQSKQSVKSLTNLGNGAYSSQSLDAQLNKIKDLQNQIRRLTKRSQQNNKHEKQGRKESLLSSYLAENRGEQIQELRRQNQNLYKRLEAIHEQQLRQMEEKKQNRKKQLQLEESKFIALKQQYQQYKKKAKQIIAQLEAHLQNQIQQNNSLKKQFKDMEQNIVKKYEFQMRQTLMQMQNLKHDKETITELYSKKVALLQQEISSKSNEYDRKLAQTQLKYESERQEIEKQHNKIILEGERHRLKYQHLLKVNNQLIKQIQDLKSKAHQITLKEKYKAKIANLFNN